MKKLFIIPVFLPWMGCSNRCIYCNENAVTGYDYLNYKDNDILEKLDKVVLDSLAYAKQRTVQIAFFGGSFSNSQIRLQEKFLTWAKQYIDRGEVDSIRISTRPDGINEKTIDLFKKFRCKSVELGVQSFDEGVLLKNNRGHDCLSAVNAIVALKNANIETGVHLMTGLYGSDKEKDLASLNQALSLKPDSLRIHPTVVLKNTPLEKLYQNGSYTPLSLRECVEELGKYILLANAQGVVINRIGLFIPDKLTSSVVGGPYHPALGDMARIMSNVIKTKAIVKEKGKAHVEKKTFDSFKSHHGFFIEYLKKELESGSIECYQEVSK